MSLCEVRGKWKDFATKNSVFSFRNATTASRTGQPLAAARRVAQQTFTSAVRAHVAATSRRTRKCSAHCTMAVWMPRWEQSPLCKTRNKWRIWPSSSKCLHFDMRVSEKGGGFLTWGWLLSISMLCVDFLTADHQWEVWGAASGMRGLAGESLAEANVAEGSPAQLHQRCGR